MNLKDIRDIARRCGFVEQADYSATHPKLGRAIKRLLEEDSSLIEVGTSERAICHRLAVHVEQTFGPESGWDVDCEYNRKGELPKELMIERETQRANATDPDQADDPDHAWGLRRVFPDVIVHHRQRLERGANLLVVEMKVLRVSSRKADVEFDLQKLTAYQRDLGYKCAAFVLVVPDPSETDQSESVLVFIPDGSDFDSDCC